MLNRVARRFQGRVHDLFEPDLPTLAEGDVGGEDEPRAAGPDALGQGPSAEPGEDHRVDGANPDGRQHHHDRLGAGWHIDGKSVSFLDAHTPERGGDSLDLVGQLRVGEQAAFTAFVDVDKSCTVAPAVRDVVVEAVVGEIGLGPEKPTETGKVPFEDAVPLAKPGQLISRLSPELFGVRLCALNQATDGWID